MRHPLFVRSRGFVAFSRVLATAAVLTFPAYALAAGPGEVEAEPLDPSIWGGEPSATCGWPSTVYVDGCTGTLVHPELVITAAHCTNNGANKQIGFGPSGNSRTRNSTCYTHPSYNGNSAAFDFAYCILAEPVTDVPIIPPLAGCDVDQYIVPGQEVDIVGYGFTDDDTIGIKYEVTTTITNYQNGEVYIGGNGLDSCNGDSGGPVFVQIDDGSWRVFGITSYGGQCGGGGVYGNIANNMAWVEEQSGFDISPCTDGDGNWMANPDCGGFPLDPGSGANTSWQEGCAGGPLSGFSETCGSPFSPEGDDDAPNVTITAPADGTAYMSGGEGLVSVLITVDANDGDGFGVEHVSLRIGGEDVPNTDDFAPPYEWNLDFPQGSWTIEAVAVDVSQNQAVSSPVTIGVDEEPEPPEPPAEEEGGDESGEDEGSDDGGEDTTTGGGDETTGGPGIGEVNDEGCSCTSDVGETGGLGGLLGLFGLLGIAHGRRRRD